MLKSFRCNTKDCIRIMLPTVRGLMALVMCVTLHGSTGEGCGEYTHLSD